MTRKCFFSFHHAADSWRVGQVRNIGVVEGNPPVSDNDWEDIKSKGDASIQQWIDEQLKNRSCTIVLVGSNTADRRWINYEIQKSWEKGMGVVGIRIHGLADRNGQTSNAGANPFSSVSVCKLHDPVGYNSTAIYGWIEGRLAEIVEKAIQQRK